MLDIIEKEIAYLESILICEKNSFEIIIIEAKIECLEDLKEKLNDN
jgi:hypothetical protein